MLYLLYKTDHRHLYAGRDLIGVFTTKQKMLKWASALMRKDIRGNCNYLPIENAEHYRWLQQFFESKNQTQGLSEFELVYEEIEPNKLF